MFSSWPSIMPNGYPSPPLAPAEDVVESSVLGGRDGQVPVALDLRPRRGVGAVEARQRGQPVLGASVALLLVDVVGDGPELGAANVVGKVLALAGAPACCAGL